MKEIYLPEDLPEDSTDIPDKYNQKAGDLYSAMIAVDVLVAEFWMLFLLLGVGNADAIDRFFKADSSSVNHLKEKMEAFSLSSARIPTTIDLMVLLGIAFVGTSLSHFLGEHLAAWCKEHIPKLANLLNLNSGFFWVIMISTTLGLSLSFTRARNLEGAGASKIGTVFIFVLVATIGMNMNVLAFFKYPGLFVVGLIWMIVHVGLLFLVGYLIRAPYFFLAVGSKANIGGAASAPVVAGAFHPSLAPVGVLLAVLGYAVGTYGAWLSANLMQWVTP
ncbi:MAG: DUF819 family protein [Pirellulaceae bacterium]